MHRPQNIKREFSKSKYTAKRTFSVQTLEPVNEFTDSATNVATSSRFISIRHWYSLSSVAVFLACQMDNIFSAALVLSTAMLAISS